MPIELGIWRIGESLERIAFSSVESETKLEEALVRDISIISQDVMLIGRQVMTSYGKVIDLLAIDAEGNLVVIELKRNRTSRDVVAQLLDYASWVQGLSYEQIADIYTQNNGGKPLEKGFDEIFGTNLPDILNQSHRLIVVASDLDPGTERIINYLSGNFGVPVNAVFFRHFRDGGSEYLTRTWLVDPNVAEAKASQTSKGQNREPWNGRDYYVSFGEGEHRHWEDARRYGFISGGQGKWYHRTLFQLEPGARVFVMIPKVGYVGVGTVKGEAVPVTEFMVMVNGEEMPIAQAPVQAHNMLDNAGSQEMQEYLVPIEWVRSVPYREAYWERGLFANQNTVCKLTNRFTLDRLVQHFELND